jgi:uncharacterized protein YndB with AHSA1/START domain
MPTQKVFKHRVRARMAKTGEAYTAARHQLLRRADGAETPPTPSAPPEPSAETPAPPDAMPAEALLVADAGMVRATGRGHAEWFAILDAWGATNHTHTEIARWLSETHETPGWWTQNLTVAYERARGMRARHQMADGFSVSVTRTVRVAPEEALAAFTDEKRRAGWLSEPMRQRPTRARNTARFDWDEPPSRVVVSLAPRDDGRTTIAVAHERLPDAETGDRLKTRWRGWLAALKTVLEAR